MPNIAEFTMDTSDPKQPNSPFRLFVYVRQAQLLTIGVVNCLACSSLWISAEPVSPVS